MVKLRVLSYGPDYSYYTNCPICGKQTKVKVDLSKLTVEQLDDFDPKVLEVVLPHRGDTVVTKIQTQEDIDTVAREAERMRERAQGRLDFDPTVVLDVVSQIAEIRLQKPNKIGQTILDNPVDIEAYVDNLTAYDAIAITSTADQVDYGIQPWVESTCEVCGEDIRVLFRAGSSEFLYPRYTPDTRPAL